MLRFLGVLILGAALAGCSTPVPEAPPVAEVGGVPPYFAIRAHGEVTPPVAAQKAAETCGAFGRAADLRRTETCPSFFRGETIPNCWVMTFRCVDAG